MCCRSVNRMRPLVGFVPHEVYGSLEGRVARFLCHLCRASRRIAEGQFDALNAFIDEHRRCVERWGSPGAT